MVKKMGYRCGGGGLRDRHRCGRLLNVSDEDFGYTGRVVCKSIRMEG
jgi:hypothetical protein